MKHSPEIHSKPSKKITLVNGKKMAVLKRRQKLTTGTKGWPRLSGSKHKHFKEEEKIESSLKLQRMKTTRIPSPQDTSEEESPGDIENANHFCKSAFFYRKLKLSKDLIFALPSRKQAPLQPHRNKSDESFQFQKQRTFDYRSRQWRVYENQFGQFTKLMNSYEDTVILHKQNHNKQKVYNRIDYNTKTQIQKNDTFKPIQRVRITRRKSLDFEINEEEMQERMKTPQENWHNSLNVQKMTLLQRKEISNRSKGLVNDILQSRIKNVKIENIEYEISSFVLNEPRRMGSLQGKKQVQEIQSQSIHRRNTERDFVKRHIFKNKEKKYKQLLKIKKEFQDSNASHPMARKLSTLSQSILKDPHYIMKYQQRKHSHDLQDIQAKMSAQIKVKTRHSQSKCGPKNKILHSNSSSKNDASSSSSEFLSSSYDHSEEIDKVEDMISVQNRRQSDRDKERGDPSYNLFTLNNVNLNIKPQNPTQSAKSSKRRGKSNEDKQSRKSDKGDEASSKSKPRQILTEEQQAALVGTSLEQLQYYHLVSKVSMLVNNKIKDKRSMTIISVGDLCEIENNMDKKHEEEVINKLESLNLEMEQQMTDLVLSTVPGSPTRFKKKKAQDLPENFMKNLSSSILSKLLHQINAKIIPALIDNSINIEQYTLNQKDFASIFIDSLMYQASQTLITCLDKEYMKFMHYKSMVAEPSERTPSFNINYLVKGKKLSGFYKLFLLDNFLNSFDLYISQTVSTGKDMGQKIQSVESKLTLFQNQRKKDDLTSVVGEMRFEFNKLYKLQLGCFSQKEMIDMFYKQFMPNRLYNLLYRRHFWMELKRSRKKILLQLPPQYHQLFTHDFKSKQSVIPFRMTKTGGTTVAQKIQAQKLNQLNKALSIISSSKPFRFKFADEQLKNNNINEFQLINKFIYYTLLQRSSPQILTEVFFVDLDPKYKKRDSNMQPRSINETESDSYKVIQALAASNDNSFFSSQPLSNTLNNSIYQGLTQSINQRIEKGKNEQSQGYSNAVASTNDLSYYSNLFSGNSGQSNVGQSAQPFRSMATLKNVQANMNKNNQAIEEEGTTSTATAGGLNRQRTMFMPKISIVREDNTILSCGSEKEDQSLSIINGGLSPIMPNHMNWNFKSMQQTLVLDLKALKEAPMELSPVPSQLEENSQIEKPFGSQLQTPKSPNTRSRRNTKYLSSKKRNVKIDVIDLNQEVLSPDSVLDKELLNSPPTQLEVPMQRIQTFRVSNHQSEQDELISATIFKKFGRNTPAIDEESILHQTQIQPPSPVQNETTINEQGYWFKDEFVNYDDQVRESFDVRYNVYDLENIEESEESLHGLSPKSPLNTKEKNKVKLWKVALDDGEELSFISLDLQDDESSQKRREKHSSGIEVVRHKKTLFLDQSTHSDWQAINRQEEKTVHRWRSPQERANVYKIDEFIMDEETIKKIKQRLGKVNEQTFSNKLHQLKKLRKKKNQKKKQEEELQLIAKTFSAIQSSNLNMMQDILQRYIGLDLEERDPKGNTYLNYAVQMGNYEISELLLKKGADVNTQNNNLNTPLHYANSYNFRRIFDLLLITYKADQTLTNLQGRTPWEKII